MRRLLTPLAELAQRLDVAVLVLVHLNKGAKEPTNSPSALYRLAGSLGGIAGVARSVLLVAKGPGDEGRRVLAHIAGNLGSPPRSLAFHLDGPADGVATVVWDGETDQAADDLVRPATEHERPLKIEEAKDFLRSLLADGPVPADRVYEAAKGARISDRTLERAKLALNIRSGKDREIKDGPWSWFPPGVPPPA
jgi:hypothetical protein